MATDALLFPSSRYEIQQEVHGYSSRSCCLLTLGTSSLITITLIVLGALATAGILSATTVGCAAMGLGAGSFVLELANGHFKARKFEFILLTLATAATITFGALGYVGMLSTFQVGLAIIGAQAAVLPFNFCLHSYKGKIVEQKLKDQASL